MVLLSLWYFLLSGFFYVDANQHEPKPVCDSSIAVSVRYSSSSKRIHVLFVESLNGTRGGCASANDVFLALGSSSPLYPTAEQGEWMLGESLYILDGITFRVYGTDRCRWKC